MSIWVRVTGKVGARGRGRPARRGRSAAEGCDIGQGFVLNPFQQSAAVGGDEGEVFCDAGRVLGWDAVAATVAGGLACAWGARKMGGSPILQVTLHVGCRCGGQPHATQHGVGSRRRHRHWWIGLRLGRKEDGRIAHPVSHSGCRWGGQPHGGLRSMRSIQSRGALAVVVIKVSRP
jgi:hypothetical protein